MPIKYESQYEYDENLNGFCNVDWLFNVFSFKLKTVNGETDYDIKIPSWLDKLLSDEDDTISEEKTVYKIENEQDEYFDDEAATEYLKDVDKKNIEKTADSAISEIQNESNNCTEEKINEDVEKAQPQKKISNENVIKFLKKSFSKIMYKIKGFLNFTKDKKAFIREKIDFYEDLKSKYDLKAIFDRTILLFKKIFKGLGLKLFQICGIIGLDNPYSTGQVIALISVVQTFVPFDVDIQGDFENNVLEGSFYIKGRLRIGSIFFPILGYLIAKPVRPVIIDYMKGDRE